VKLLHRIGYYLGGFSIGLVVLAFFLNGKKVSCDYGPEARVLKNINSKKLEILPEFKEAFLNKNIDSTEINTALKFGNILFSESDTRKKPCGVYYIENTSEDAKMDLKVENCENIATIIDVVWK
jgi:hypothetical protein